MLKYGRKFQPSCIVNATRQYFAALLMPGQQHCFLLHLYLASRLFTFPMTAME